MIQQSNIDWSPLELPYSGRISALVISILVIISTVVLGAGVVAGGTVGSAADTTEKDSVVESELADSDGTVEVIVRFDAADQKAVREEGVNALKAHASSSQSEFEQLAATEDGITIENQFWLANAALVTIDTDSVDLRSIATLEDVADLHKNARIELPDKKVEKTKDDRLVTASGSDVTTGLDQINAQAAWEKFGTRGENVTVAVLDTGIDVDHPDLELKTDNGSDPTYPGGWAEFDTDGTQIEDSIPYESHFSRSHGTHVSGTVAGGNESGTAVGVAPEADLMHGLVLPGGSGRPAQTLAGMEWAVENDADVIVTSLDHEQFSELFIEPVRNANDAGVAVVAASGNNGAGTSAAPANVYESVAVGSVDDTATVDVNSSGETIETDADWDDPPESWPDSYTVPDVTAPGVDVKSTIAGGEYDTISGTSMAAPHVGGIYALALAEDDDHTLDEIQHALEETAHHPDGDRVDHRYGHGVVDAEATLEALTDGVVTGTVTDETGDPVSNATVTLDSRVETTTDDDGTYELAVTAGVHNVTVDAFGYGTESETVTVDDETATADFELESKLAGLVTDGQPELSETGETITVELTVANADSLAVEPIADGELDGNETLTVNGESYAFGEVVPLDDGHETITVALETANETPESVALEYTLIGSGDETAIASDSTTVLEDVVNVGVIDDAKYGYGSQIATVLEEKLDGAEISLEQSEVVLNAESPPHDVYVVQKLSEANAEGFVEATNSSAVGVVYLDQWGEDATGIPRYVSVTNDPAVTGQDDGYEDDSVEAPVSYTVETEHPILSGESAGTELTIHDGPFADHTWFAETSFDVIASVTHGGTEGSIGPALAVDDDSNTVLASSLGHTYFVTDESYTDEASTILAKSVAYATPDSDEGTTTEPAVQIGSVESFSDYPGTVAVNTTADGIAGYQLTLEYDPDVVQITGADGGDFDEPVMNVDNENGTVFMAQTAVEEIDEPTLAELELEFVGEQGETTALTIDESETKLSNSRGDEQSIEGDDGVASTLACLPGDVSGDGAVTISDATMTQQSIVGNPIENSFEPVCADLTRDGDVTSGDVTLILEEIVGLERAAPLEG